MTEPGFEASQSGPRDSSVKERISAAVLKLEALQNLWEGLLPHRFLGLTPEILVQSGG